MIRRFQALVIGSGAAGYGAADRLFREGITDIALLTEGRRCGTSRNTGSDKQTYYKLSLCGDAMDCPAAMARDLCAGGGMDGDKAYAQAQESPRAFYRLLELGVPFPRDGLGGFPGYRTDHDSTRRATSVGPLTSRLMTEALERRVLGENGTPLFDSRLVTRVVTGENGVCGVIALHTPTGNYEAFEAPLVFAATGAPACVYRDSVYPVSQHGMTGVLLSAGVRLSNFAHWQYGIASTGFRWNLSGSFMQAVPRFVSADETGAEYEFLSETFPDPGERFTNIFLKGYQWPFAADRAGGSSAVDLAVHAQAAMGRRVYLDYTREPEDFTPALLSEEAREYLTACGALADTPFGRLCALNTKAAALYRENGYDLARDRLPVAVSAQHCNGGVDTDLNGETCVPGLYVLGEAAGNFGVTRPGGAALNDTQVSGFLAAAHAASRPLRAPEEAPLAAALAEAEAFRAAFREDQAVNYEEIPAAMSGCAAFIRSEAPCRELLARVETLLQAYPARHASLEKYHKDLDMLISARALLVTVLGEMPVAGSRGGAVWQTESGFAPENREYRACRTVTENGAVRFVPVAPVPRDDRPFEYFLNRLRIPENR